MRVDLGRQAVDQVPFTQRALHRAVREVDLSDESGGGIGVGSSGEDDGLNGFGESGKPTEEPWSVLLHPGQG